MQITNKTLLATLSMAGVAAAQIIDLSDFDLSDIDFDYSDLGNLTQYAQPAYCGAVYNCAPGWNSVDGKDCIDAWCNSPFGGSCDDLKIADKACCKDSNPATCFEQAHPRKVNLPGVGGNIIPSISLSPSQVSMFEPCSTAASLATKCAGSLITATTAADLNKEPTESQIVDLVKCACFDNGKFNGDLWDGSAKKCFDAAQNVASINFGGLDVGYVTEFCKRASVAATSTGSGTKATGSGTKATGTVSAATATRNSTVSGNVPANATGINLPKPTGNGASGVTAQLSVAVVVGFVAALVAL